MPERVTTETDEVLKSWEPAQSGCGKNGRCDLGSILLSEDSVMGDEIVLGFSFTHKVIKFASCCPVFLSPKILPFNIPIRSGLQFVFIM